MREIKFKGKDIRNGEWLFGFYHKTEHHSATGQSKGIFAHIYCDNFDLAVDEDTVGQYTGLKDKNGKEIYEGDIVEFDSDKKKSAVIWSYGKYNQVTGFRLERYPLFSVCEHNCGLFEVVGNIHDNPELLEANNGNK